METQVDPSLETRVARLEGVLGFGRLKTELSPRMQWTALALGTLGLITAFLGLGLPNHYFQVVFAVITMLLAYSRGWLPEIDKPLLALLALVNMLTLSLLYKLIIGLGTSRPLAWLRLPVIESSKDSGMLPSLGFKWSETELSAFAVDFTILQSFLLLITLLGAVLGFQLFVSLTALLLVLLSLPAVLTFDWELSFWAIIFLSSSLFLLARGGEPVEKGS